MSPAPKKWSLRPGRYAEDEFGNRFYVLAFHLDDSTVVRVESVATKERFDAPVADLTRVVLEGEMF